MGLALDSPAGQIGLNPHGFKALRLPDRPGNITGLYGLHPPKVLNVGLHRAVPATQLKGFHSERQPRSPGSGRLILPDLPPLVLDVRPVVQEQWFGVRRRRTNEGRHDDGDKGGESSAHG